MGKKPTKYFFQLKNKRQSRNSITELHVNNLSVTSDKNILQECRYFYKTLYTVKLVNLESQDWLLDQLDTALTADDQHRCEGELTLNERFEAVSQLSSNKSPESDGLPVQFYRCFWSLLGPDLVAILNYSYTYGSLSNTQRRGINRLLFKKDDPLELKNWPHISLLNTDYTICMTVLPNRLRNVLPQIINKDQRCGIPYHSISRISFYYGTLLTTFNINI